MMRRRLEGAWPYRASLFSRRRRGNRRSATEHTIPDLRKSSNYNPMVARRIEMKKAAKKLTKPFLCVNFVLQNHLQHRLPEIHVRIVRVFLNCHADAADLPEASSDDLGGVSHVGIGQLLLRRAGWWPEEAAVGVGGRGLGLGAEDLWDDGFGLSTTAAANVDGDCVEEELSFYGGHCRRRRRNWCGGGGGGGSKKWEAVGFWALL